MTRLLTRDDYANAARSLGCDIAMVHAVAKVESLGGGFLPDGQPKILFERHWFHRYTNGRYDISHPDISNVKPGGYIGGAKEHGRLAEAALLDRHAALESTSWGMFQLMGFNHAICGFSDIQGFINAMYSGEPAQLEAFVAFIKSKKLDVPMKHKDFAALASGYNGANYAINKYDEKIKQAFIQYGGIL